MNEINLRAVYSHKRATLALEQPVDFAYSGYGNMLSEPPSFRAGYRLLDYGDNLCQIFGGFATHGMGSYDFDVHILIEPHKKFTLLATAESANKIIQKVEVDSILVYKISSNADFAFGAKLKGSGIFTGWYASLYLSDLSDFYNTVDRPEENNRHSFLSIGKQYDERLLLEVRGREDGRQLIISYLFN